MPPKRPTGADEPDARTALLDAVERLMLAEGYAAVTSRRVAAEAEVNPGLVYYYFGPMDNLFVEVFRRSAARMLGRQAEALASDQPLWALWDLIRDQSNTTLNLEFLALGNHRQAVKDEMKDFSVRFRRVQFDGLTDVLAKYDVDTEQWPAEAVMLFLDGVGRFMGEERSYGLDLGHEQAIRVVERLIGRLEGRRRVRRRRSRR
ncbi:TetR/AcrR family transcriptional regulator [Mycolicibacterium holsaticum]|uniref:TetR/AcrR family transcriptional regulator n=1 Tax=Mycolicibacterium holsaticum TaxID=152142 RepID=UPI001C7CF0B4|nr:TetR/AcrR family transcriptional regulator [Mycolicibacterium holsaticum]MDA4106794.1 TetR family transcriptional regulator [Mycolicibacterium holsaticum DSM 44478 = JCM 12374]QZA14084.1 TetR/AcrR family transcriptional regulator [Mycolicibacterium holsaticum DSM 44478 = JCM 12374]UNC08459.1 TetR/AcrR family transcriptional regulator [Mycolicibacterium holsaticum DSM 44478 = JCM 12374]